MSIYDEIDPIAYAELYQSIYPDWKGKQEFLDLLGQNPDIETRPTQVIEAPAYQTELTVPVTEVAIQGIVEDAPAEDEEYIDFTPDERVPLKCDGEARLLGYFCTTVLERLQHCDSKTREWEQITLEYNSNNLVPELYALKGKRTERALRIWIGRYLETKQNMYALLHGNRYQRRQRKITELEGKVLLAILLHPNRVSIGSALKLLKAKAEGGMIASPSSSPTLRRWVEEWRDDNLAIWEQARQGSKYVAEHIIKTIHRDSRLLSVGEVWVADGHTLAFDILNPKTGKAQRMTMIMVMDWASRYPVGAALAYTEDSQHIQLAFRNGFLNWGGVPKFVYLDNGKAFRSKLFNEKWQDHDLATELSGIFPRLGIGVVFAESYNAKAKIIERFFKTFQERFERFISSFRGASVADKPATLMRNEKWAQKMYAAQPPTIEEAMQMIGFFIRYIYGETPHGGMHGKTPWAVFRSAEVPGAQKIEAKRLNYLMMSAVRKTLRNNGLVLNKMQYWSTELIEHIGKELLIRYDLSDARWILVYDLQDNFICQAELRKAVDPFIHLDLENPVSVAEVKKEYKAIKRHQRLIANRTRITVRKTQEVVDAYVKHLTMPALEDNPTFIQAPAIEAPQPGAEQIMEALEKQAMKKLPNLLEVIKRPAVQEDDEESKPRPKTRKEMLKFIGIS